MSNFSGASLPEDMANRIMLEAQAKRAVAALMAQREEVIKAYIAKFGFQPEGTIQVEEIAPDGTHRWYLRKMNAEERKRAGLPEPE